MRKRKLNKTWFENNITQIEKLAAKTGKIKDIEELLGASNSVLHYHRKQNPILEVAIQQGLSQYKTTHKATPDPKIIKSPKVLIASLSSVEDNSGQALAAYRRKKIEEHESRLRTQVRSVFEYII